MTKKTTAKNGSAQSAPAEEMPTRGGSFIRNPDGTLGCVERTRNHDDDDDDEGGAATPPADPPREPETATDPATAPAALGEAD